MGRAARAALAIWMQKVPLYHVQSMPLYRISAGGLLEDTLGTVEMPQTQAVATLLPNAMSFMTYTESFGMVP